MPRRLRPRSAAPSDERTSIRPRGKPAPIGTPCRRRGFVLFNRSYGIIKLSGGWHSRHMTSQTPNYHGYRFPPEIISHAVWLYHRFCLSFRDAEDLLAQRGVTVTYETIRHWCHAFGPDYARRLRRGRGRMGDTWSLDELFVTIQGRRQYLWRAVDQDGDLIDGSCSHDAIATLRRGSSASS